MNPNIQEIDQHELRALPSSHEFTRNQIWNERLNCPYYGLVKIRENQERGINAPSRNDFIVRGTVM